MLGQAWAEKSFKAPCLIASAKPFRGSVGVLLVRISDEPMSNRLARPILAGARRRRDFARLSRAIPHVDAQAPEAGLTRLRPGVVDSNVPIESRAHIFARTGTGFRKATT